MTDADAMGPDSREQNPSKTSLRALDAVNVFLADVRDGMGPFLGTFLRENQHWDAGRVGIALAASQIGTVLAQTPCGALIDRIRWKRLAVALAAAVVAAGCIVLYLVPTLAVVVAAQTAIGAAAAIFPPAVAALSLGLVGRAAMARRTGRNEAFNHGGNVVAAALAGGLAYLVGYGAMFLLVAGMAAASAVAVLGLLAPVSPGPLGSVGGLRPFPGHIERLGVEPCEGGFHLRLQFGVPLPLERHLGPGLGPGLGHHLLQGVVEGGLKKGVRNRKTTFLHQCA